jgi:nitrogen-specific signal transduction histidine kinase
MTTTIKDPGAKTPQRQPSEGDAAAQRSRVIVARLQELARAELAATLALVEDDGDGVPSWLKG